MKIIPKRVRVLAAALSAAMIFLNPPLSYSAAFDETPRDIWQYFVPDNGSDTMGTYMWIPPGSKYIKGILVASKWMVDSMLFESSAIRKVCEKNHLAIVQLAGVSVVFTDATVTPNKYLTFNYKDKNVTFKFNSILKSMADQSGYPEIVNAPFITTGHSGTVEIPFYMAYWNPGKTIAVATYETYYRKPPKFDPDATLKGVPMLYGRGIQYEWGEVVIPFGENNNLKDYVSYFRQSSLDSLAGAVIDYGGGHFDWTEKLAVPYAMFIDKACKYRLPDSPDPNGAITLNYIPPESGWLVDRRIDLDKGYSPAAPYSEYKGNKEQALWFFDEEMAKTCESFMRSEYCKKTQMFTLMDKGAPAQFPSKGPPGSGLRGCIHLSFDPLEDGMSFKLAPSFFEEPPSTKLGTWSLNRLSHSGEPMKYKKLYGPLMQVSQDTFRVRLNRDYPNFLTSGNKGIRAYVCGYMYGDEEFRGAVRPAELTIPCNTTGQSQTLQFPEISDITTDTKEVKLDATASSGLPVEYFMVAGPAVLEKNTLKITEIPINSAYPIKVKVAAYQWGQGGDNPFKTVPPVYRSFNITKKNSPNLKNSIKTSERPLSG